MERNRNAFAAIVCLAFGIVAVFGSKTFMSVENNKKAILPCTEFEEVVKLDGVYKFVKWYMWTSNGLDDPHWKWFIGMNQDGVTNPLKGFNVSKENGSLCIQEAKPCDAREFMCVVDRINGKSPKRHFVTLQLINESGNRTTASTKAKEHTPQDCNCKKADSNETAYATALVIVVLIAVAEGGFILYRERNYLRALFYRCLHRADTDPGDTDAPD